MRKQIKIILIGLIIFLILLAVFSYFFIIKKSTLFNEKISLCQNSAGEWKTFNNACADTCQAKMELQFCADVLTDSCDCGENKCWNGEKCIPDILFLE